jgi:hypothetical protein
MRRVSRVLAPIGVCISAVLLFWSPADAAAPCTLWDSRAGVRVRCPGDVFPTTCAANVSQLGLVPYDDAEIIDRRGQVMMCIGGDLGGTFQPVAPVTEPLVTTLDQAFDEGNGVITGLTAAKPLALTGTDPDGARFLFYETGGDMVFACELADGTPCEQRIEIGTNRSFIISGVTAGELERLTQAGVHTYSGSGKPRKSVFLAADSLYMQGCTQVTDTALVAGGLVEPYLTCGDNNAHGFHRGLVMPDSWDAGSITVQLNVINVNASPANNYEIDFSAECDSNADTIATTISTTGEQPALIDFDANQSCGVSACAQNARVKVTTAAITPNGSCAKGDLLRIQGQVDATNTTTAQVADVKIYGLLIEYSVDSRSD